MLFEVVEVLDQLGWEECSLIGHSMGAGVATCVAGILRERVKRLILVEGLGPLSQPAEKVTELMRDSIQQWNSLKTKKSPVYQNREEAVRARHFAGKLKKSSVETLVARGLGENTDGLVWRSDPRLRIKSRLYLSEAQILQMIQDITAQVLVIEAEDTDTRRWVDLLRSRLGYVKNLDHRILPGGHHLHLDEPQSVASAIKDFLE
jgi:pimeloyl-ACP methyl ester carboxylesterase